VNLERCRLAIRRQIRKHRIGSPKSGKPRTVSVPPSTIAVLRGWIDTIRAEAAVRGQEATWLFPGATGESFEDKCPAPAMGWIPRLAHIGRKIRVHDLRHTYASLAIQRGVPLLTVSRQLGHSSIAITADIYGHLVPDATREAAAAWEAILTPLPRNPRATPAQESA
jgi:integrase